MKLKLTRWSDRGVFNEGIRGELTIVISTGSEFPQDINGMKLAEERIKDKLFMALYNKIIFPLRPFIKKKKLDGAQQVINDAAKKFKEDLTIERTNY